MEKTAPSSDTFLKDVLDIPDPEPFFHEGIVPFLEWLADYYLCPIGKVIQSALPGGVESGFYNTAHLTEKGQNLLESAGPDSEERGILSWTMENPGKRIPWTTHRISQLERRGLLILERREKRRRAGPLKRRFIRLKREDDLSSALGTLNQESGTANEVEFLRTIFDSGSLLARELSSSFPNGSYLIQKWMKKGILEGFTGPVYRDPFGKIICPSPHPEQLYEQQSHALDQITLSLEKQAFSSYLLYGVTGSGKTEVYIRAVDHVTRFGRQAIVMVPEIALALYVEGMFRSRLGNKIAIYHSGLSEGERYDQWMRMVRGEADVVIGARSALFAPLPRLGLIIVDEEHDSAYKQEKSLRYQARDAAVMRGKMERAVVVLGSGTPSVSSFQNCLSGRYHLLSMPDRVEKRPLPDVDIVDMKEGEGVEAKDRILSRRLRESLKEELTAGNQAILFLNRRGFHRLYLCRACGQSIRCPNCDVALTYHLHRDVLTCHYCGFHMDTQPTCPSCGREALKPFGFGTERLEYELKELFPETTLARMDTDSIRRKGQAFHILKKFRQQEIQILLGTQMITKGYDFPGVTLVGVIAADLSLAFPDFRAGERTFQILSQVSGRAGRGTRKGKVIIQAFNSEHYAIRAAMAHDYASFFEKEKGLREQLGYPPFSYLVCLRLKGNSKKKAAEAAAALGVELRRILKGWTKRGTDVHVLGPVEASISRLRGKYRWQILLRSKRAALLKHLLSRVDAQFIRPLQTAGIQLVVDVDPYQMV